ncbi:hypothetical protein LZ30DRAFT_737487 [Colletotrichum cereale]|nr:hypothetical protein LZ30DRAFT_737487 [Colletotrichum cereale]
MPGSPGTTPGREKRCRRAGPTQSTPPRPPMIVGFPPTCGRHSGRCPLRLSIY